MSLVHELWGDQPADGAQHTLDVHVSRLRKTLSAAAEARPDDPARRLQPPAGRRAAGCADVRAPGRGGPSALAGNRPEQAAAKLRAALRLWRGQALADLADGPGLRAEAARLEELRLCAVEDRIEADLALGLHEDVVGELQALVLVHPLRERLHGS